MAPVGRWQKGRDLNWYAKTDAEGNEVSEADARKEEIRKVKQAEEEALAKALGIEPPQSAANNANMLPVGGEGGLSKMIDGGKAALDVEELPRKERRRHRSRSRDGERLERRRRRSRSRAGERSERRSHRSHRSERHRDMRSRSRSRDGHRWRRDSRSRSRGRHGDEGDYRKRDDRPQGDHQDSHRRYRSRSRSPKGERSDRDRRRGG
jgi:hypothetical protein